MNREKIEKLKNHLKSSTKDGYTVWCYNERTYYGKTYSKEAFEVRGVVVHDPTNAIVAWPPGRMTNLKDIEESKYTDKIRFSDKIDGTMIVVFQHSGMLHFSTKASLDNQYIDKAKELWSSISRPTLREGLTLVLELTHSDKEIVVKSSVHELYLISARELATGVEYGETGLDELAKMYNLLRPPHIESTLAEMRKRALVEENREGWVGSVWQDENLFRIKVKTLWYLTKQRKMNSITQNSVKAAWQSGERLQEYLSYADDHSWIPILVEALDEYEKVMFNNCCILYQGVAGHNRKYASAALVDVKNTPAFHIVMKALDSKQPYAVIGELSIKQALKDVCIDHVTIEQTHQSDRNKSD